MSEIFVVQTRGIGKPDYQQEVFRGKQIFGYTLEEGEELLWMTIICMNAPGPSIITRGPLLVGETAFALEFPTGLPVAVIPAGWDYLWKELWIGFDQDVRYEMIQGGTFNDVSCMATIAGGSRPANFMQTGCSRGLTEDLTVPSTVQISVTNLGTAPAIGKIWFVAVKKRGVYYWR